MDSHGYVKTRKGRVMAQMLSAFEELIEPHVPKVKSDQFKGIIRGKLHQFESDIGEMLDMMHSGQTPNAHAQALKDRLPDRRGR